ncbi:uncharacterized protein [Epargyreus clarus]|uniref:uncharacterized protein n=1 Tax=Epargyreus clarus TaxID=520877 RepID=UPI003C2E8831
MNSKTVKCASCNVVINELLAFLANVLDYMDEESIHQLVSSSFSVENITKAKSLLFESLPNAKRMTVRRKDGKKRISRDLDDILGLMKATNAETFPIFVAKDLHQIPSVSFDHIDSTRLLKDIVRLQKQVSTLEEKVVTTEMFERLRLEVENLKHASIVDSFPCRDSKVNKIRGACMNDSFYELSSGPIGLQYVPIKSTQIPAEEVNCHSTPSPACLSTISNNKTESVSLQRGQTVAIEIQRRVEAPTAVSNSASEDPCDAGVDAISASKMSTQATHSEAKDITVVSNEAVITCAQATTHAPTLISKDNGRTADSFNTQETRQINDLGRSRTMNAMHKQEENSEWKIVQRKTSKKYKLIGQKGCASTSPNGKFKAADVKIPLFISNVSKEASEQDIISYIQDKTSEDVTLKKIQVKSNKKYNAFKVYVPKNKVELFLKDDFWPDGITFRRFVRFLYGTKQIDRNVIVS